MNGKILYIYSLHKWNLNYLTKEAKKGHEIVFLKNLSKTDKLPKNFRRIHNFSTIDEWTDSLEESFQYMQGELKKTSFPQVFLSSRNGKVPFFENFFEEFSTRYEQFILFHFLVRKENKKNGVILDSVFLRYMMENFPGLYPINSPVKLKRSKSYFYDLLFEWEETINLNFKFLGKLILLPKKEVPPSINYVVRGISTLDISDEKNALDFSWLTKNGILPKENAIFILPPIKKEEIEKIASKHADLNVIGDNQLISFIPFSRRLVLSLKVLRKLLLSLSNTKFDQLVLFRSLERASIWDELIHVLPLKKYITTISESWPSGPELALLNQKNIETVMWAYGQSEFRYNYDKKLNDVTLRLSISPFQKILFWNELTKSLIENRTITIPEWSTKTSYHVVGPTLNGDLKKIRMDQKEALKLLFPKEFDELKDKFVISAFDLTPLTPEHCLQHGAGPYSTYEIQNKFYLGLEEVLSKNPDVVLILKPKREMGNRYEVIDALEKMTASESKWIKEKRIIRVGLFTDLYPVISASNLVLSSALTSPTMLGLALGVPAYYFDPANKAHFFFQNYYRQYFLSNTEDLASAVKQIQNGLIPEGLTFPEQFTSEKMIERLKSVLK